MTVDDLSGRVAVVTGGGSGIGRALVLEFASQGMATVVADIEGDKAEAVSREAAVAGSSSIAVRTDVADPSSVVELAETTIKRFGQVDVLCNNAGVLLFKDFADSIIEDWQWVYGVNVMGVINGVTAFLPIMLDQETPGHIVNTSSIAALGATGIYGTSKAAILTLSDSLADELAETSIGVSVLLPGMINSQIVVAERNRPAEMGRRTEHPSQEFAGLYGLDPSLCARRVTEALRSGERYVFAGIPADTFDLETTARERFTALLEAIPRGIVSDA